MPDAPAYPAAAADRADPSDPTLALVMVVRDEARFLRDNLAYHRRLGVDRAYLFLDRCTDDSRTIAEAFPWVRIVERDRDAEAQPWMSTFQTACLDEALQWARNEGLDWLLHLDPDEFARGDARGPLARRWPLEYTLTPTPERLPRPSDRLKTMLRRTPRHVEQVVLPPLDAMPTPDDRGRPFHHIQWWQRRDPITRGLLDPTDGEVRRLHKRLGHYHGKALIRTAADVRAASAHRWTRADADPLNPTPIPTIERGRLYHFILVDGELWWRKHRKFAEYPDRWEKGTKVRFPKQAWKEASRDMSLGEAQAYFDRWLRLPRRRLRREALRGRVVRDRFVRRMIESTDR